MAQRLNRDPAYDLARHIITGERGPLSGDPVIQQYDQEADRNSPMEDITAGHGDNFIVPIDAAGVDANNHAQTIGLQSMDPYLGMEAVDLGTISENRPQPSQGGISYGDHAERGRK